MMRGQLSAEWLLATFALLLALSAISAGALKFQDASNFALSNSMEQRSLARQAMALHSQMFASSSLPPAVAGIFSNGTCIRHVNGTYCQPMASRMHVDRGVLKYDGLQSREPV